MAYLRLRLPQAETDRPRLFRLFLATHSQESFAKQTPSNPLETHSQECVAKQIPGQPTRTVFPGFESL